MHFTPDGHGSYKYVDDTNWDPKYKVNFYDKRQAAAARIIAAPLSFVSLLLSSQTPPPPGLRLPGKGELHLPRRDTTCAKRDR